MIKSFKLAGKTYRVKLFSHDSDNLGVTRSPLGEVEIQTVWKGKKVPEDSQEQTFYHELVHCILDDIGHADLSEDEVLVQNFGKLLHQFMQTKK